ncbi:MAG: hypothetical protein IKQ71_05100 [Lachnospiraceae bacterium]|nr:hypothetical protein [Lachnospiraceae bacterium]
MKTFKRTIISVLMLAMAFTWAFVPVHAAGAKVTIGLSSATVKEGGKVTVTVTVKTDNAIGAYSMSVSYDSSVLEYASGAGSGSGGTVKIAGYGDGTSKKLSASLTFKAVGSGSTSIKTSGGEVYDWDENSLKISHASTKVTVGSGATTTEATTTQAATEATTEAPTTTEATTEKQTTEATTATEAPKTTEATTAATTTEATTEKVTTTEATTTEATTVEETTEAAPVLVEVEIDGEKYTFPESIEEIEVPVGFDPVTIDYKGTEVNAFSGANGSFTIVCLKASDGSYKWFIYEGGEQFTSYFELEKMNETLYVIRPDESVAIPEGYKSLELLLGENILPCFSREEDSEVVLVYAKKQSGEAGFYLYDTVERGFIRYVEPETTEEVTEATTEEEKKEEEKKTTNNLPVMILCFFCGFIPGIALYLTKRSDGEGVEADPSEKMSDTEPEKKQEKKPDKEPEKKSEKKPDKEPEKKSEKKPDKELEKKSEKKPDKVPEKDIEKESKESSDKALSRKEALDMALGTEEDRDKKEKHKKKKDKKEKSGEIKLPKPEEKKVKNDYVDKEKKKEEELEDKAAKLVSKLELDKEPSKPEKSEEAKKNMENTGPVPVIELPVADEKGKDKPLEKEPDKEKKKD